MTTSLTPAILSAVLGYLLGSIPFGVIVTRMGGAGDLRRIGSGNIGATNVLRTGRRDLAALTLIGDGGKGAAAVLAAQALFGGEAALIAGGAAFTGHVFPVWLRFRGGKGVATFFGVLLAAMAPVGVASGLVWLAAAAALRFSSMAALAAAASAPLLALGLGQGAGAALLAALMAALIFIRHLANIRRLIRGEEPRIARRAASGDPAAAGEAGNLRRRKIRIRNPQ